MITLLSKETLHVMQKMCAILNVLNQLGKYDIYIVLPYSPVSCFKNKCHIKVIFCNIMQSSPYIFDYFCTIAYLCS